MKRDPKHILYGLREDQYSLKGIALLALLYFGSLIAGAILSLIAFKLTHWLDPDASSYLANKPYPKFFDRARWFSVLLILPYLFVQCRVTSFRAIGFSRGFALCLSKWFAYGALMIGLIYGTNYCLGAFVLSESVNASLLLSKLDDALLAGLVVATLEEIVFRGLVFRMFYTAVKPLAAIILSSAFFAILHFKTPESSLGDLAPSAIGLTEAFFVAWETAAALVTRFDLSYLLAIFLVGVVLHQVFLLTNNQWANIGIHAGWVATIKLGMLTFANGDATNAFTGTTAIADGYWVSVVLLIFVALFGLQLKRRKSS